MENLQAGFSMKKADFDGPLRNNRQINA